MVSVTEFACATMAADACTSILYLESLVLSDAISTSRILPAPADKFVLDRDRLS